MNGRFTFDTLGVIFDFYREEETIYYPLETLLLVCKSWNQAALGHRWLWGRLNILIGHYPSSTWISRLPRRLERAGNSTLLDISIRSIFHSIDLPEEIRRTIARCPRGKRSPLGYIECLCFSTATATMHSLLPIIKGPHGSISERWRSLSICAGDSDLGSILTYPTPNLTSLYLESPRCNTETNILPSVPNLRTLTIDRCVSFPLPNLEVIRKLELDLSVPRHFDLSKLRTAINVEELSICIPHNITHDLYAFDLPDTLPNLSVLSLSGNRFPFNMEDILAPNLRRLSLKSYDTSNLQAIANSCLPLGKLEELELNWPYQLDYQEVKGITADILRPCVNLSRIEGEMRSLSVIVKLYWEQCAAGSSTKAEKDTFISGRPFVFQYNKERGAKSVTTFIETLELEKVASRLGLYSPRMTWDDILNSL